MSDLPKEVYGVPRGESSVTCYERLSTAKGQATRRNKKAVIGYIDRWETVEGGSVKKATPQLEKIVNDLGDWLDSKEGKALEVSDTLLYEFAFDLLDRLFALT